MSIQSAKAYLAKLKSDQLFAQEIGLAGGGKAQAALIKAAGFQFTDAELKEAAADLCDDDLNSVSGGRIYIDGKPPEDYLNNKN